MSANAGGCSTAPTPHVTNARELLQLILQVDNLEQVAQTTLLHLVLGELERHEAGLAAEQSKPAVVAANVVRRKGKVRRG
jgi:hypothetical protein